MVKTIFINVTAAEYGGALTILKSVLTDISQKDNTNLYYVFTSIDLDEFETDKIKIINTIKGKKSRKRWDRMLWDFRGLKKWSSDNDIYADIILSLQNTGVNYLKNTLQIIYIHQSLPFQTQYKWSFWNKEERICWIYQNIYPFFIKRFITQDTIIIVQQTWLKNKVFAKFFIDKNRIKVIPPKLTLPKVVFEKNYVSKEDKNNIILFYPASPFIYKNHTIIINSLIKIKNENINYYSRLRVYFTAKLEQLSKDDAKKIIDNSLKNIIFLGTVKPSQMVEYYNKCSCLIFPSYIETFGLPLLEAASLGKKIICSDTSFSREILDEYQGVIFLKYNNEDDWVNEIYNLDSYIEKKYQYIYKASKDYDSVYDLLEKYFK
ncbi:glycosyltransferase [Clostridium sp.]|uniref:glycosyltransferase n=1 Tax=Clostridium sp. TaxID=1506 RepID=UPI001A5792E6|nr:glycosyltransferase [Clostridium sp.]MBK5240805.1 glycosyltransferase [Clostridium sp.]